MEKVFMLIQRGLTDRTPVCVFPWEQPILEEIHGGNAQPVTIDGLCDLQGASKVTKMKMLHPKAEEGPTMREQYEAMVKVDAETSPLNDPEAEFGRMVEVYGMHVNVKLPNVEKVFGSPAGFRKAMRDYAHGNVPDFVGETGPIETEAAEAEEKPRRRRAA